MGELSQVKLIGLHSFAICILLSKILAGGTSGFLVYFASNKSVIEEKKSSRLIYMGHDRSF